MQYFLKVLGVYPLTINSDKKNFVWLFFFIFLCLIFGNGLGGYFTFISVETWYQTLNKPSFKYLEKDEKEKEIINQSIEVFLTSLQITFKTIKNSPFGVGFNRYQVAHKKYIDEVVLVDPEIRKNNIYDGSSNISKLITEFGIFGIFFIITFIYTTIKFKKIEGKKFFLISLIFLQFLRGVGYFNGGFLLLAIIYFYSYFKIREKND